MSSRTKVVTSGGFDDITSRDIRFLEEASKLGELTVLLWPDAVLEKVTGRPPKFPLAERRYFLSAVRYVHKVVTADASANHQALPKDICANVWADYGAGPDPVREKYARKNKIIYRSFSLDSLKGFSETKPPAVAPRRKKVVVTGCYDWLHSGHVRFFEEVSGYGDLYAVVGHDANIRLLKGEGHPLLSR